jgi:glucose-6-phosphate 1-dehydrogenase
MTSATTPASPPPRRVHGSTPRPDDHVIVMFGATGDLARRKLLPGLFRLAAAGLMPDRYQIIGSARRGLTSEQFREHARQAVADFGTIKPEGDAWDAFQRSLSFASAEPGRTEALAAAGGRAEREIGGALARLCHLAVPPAAFESTLATLSAAGLAAGSRVIIEKPFGTDLASARELNQKVHALFSEPQVFRIDHFLGKESVGNILAFRFANGLFEPVWNRNHIAYVQIDVPETLSIEGRADFYDHTGAYRDMIVTHLFQVLGFVAMEPPTSLDARHLRDETAKVFDAVRPIDIAHVVRGQYAGYAGEPGVAEGSGTETMAAVRAEVDNWRWAGVPFLLRSGKRLAASRQAITLGFHQPPLRMFPVRRDAAHAGRRNEIVIDFADPGSITTSFLAKEPGATMRLGPAELTFHYADSFRAALDLEGYERLLLDAMLGDQSLFTSDAAIERLWEISAPLLEHPPPVQPYAPGSWGPQPALDHLAAPYHWHLS